MLKAEGLAVQRNNGRFGLAPSPALQTPNAIRSVRLPLPGTPNSAITRSGRQSIHFIVISNDNLVARLNAGEHGTENTGTARRNWNPVVNGHERLQ